MRRLPVRVYQRFSTLHAISNGRAEVILGRGSFTESYPLFGYELGDYDALFATMRSSSAHHWQPGVVIAPWRNAR